LDAKGDSISLEQARTDERIQEPSRPVQNIRTAKAVHSTANEQRQLRQVQQKNTNILCSEMEKKGEFYLQIHHLHERLDNSKKNIA
jgi:hypothetical protein